MGTVLLIVLVVVVVVLVIFAIVTYNGLVRRRNETEEAYRQIDVQLKRRYDLIPNLLEGVKKYFRQEQDVLTQITQARSQAMQPQSPGSRRSPRRGSPGPSATCSRWRRTTRSSGPTRCWWTSRRSSLRRRTRSLR